MADARWTVDEINGWDRDTFVVRLGFVFEGSPWIAAEAAVARPFGRRADLHHALLDVVAGAEAERQVALIRAHPDLVGRAARAGTLTRESTGEQTAAGLDPNRLSPDEVAAFTRFNDAYHARFGFPFVICARDQTTASILSAFARRLKQSRDEEITTALDEIGKIARHRLADVVVDR